VKKAFSNSSLILIIAIICAKLLGYLLFIHGTEFEDVGPFNTRHDFSEYVIPIDNLIERGKYAMYVDSEPYAGRLPGFVFPYVLFRLFATPKMAVILEGSFLLIISIISTSLLLKRVFVSVTLPGRIAVFFCIVLFPYYWYWDWVIHPNSLAVSCLYFAIYFFPRAMNGQTLWPTITISFFLTWLFMLRGFTFFIFPLTLVVLCFAWWRYSRKLSYVACKALFFVLPFVLFEGVWITRNYVSLGKFVPLQTSFVPGANTGNSEYSFRSPAKPSLVPVRELVDAWGGDNFWYFKNGDFGWLVDSKQKAPATEVFPKVVFDAGIGAEELIHLKQLIQQSYIVPDSALELSISATAVDLRARFMETQTWYHFLVSPLNRARNFLARNVVQDWPGPSFLAGTIPQKVFKLLSVASYWFSILVLVAAVIFYRKQLRSSLYIAWMICNAACLILVFSTVINAAHYTYFATGYVLLVVSGILLFWKAQENNV
jgi:hypothetical protein